MKTNKKQSAKGNTLNQGPSANLSLTTQSVPMGRTATKQKRQTGKQKPQQKFGKAPVALNTLNPVEPTHKTSFQPTSTHGKLKIMFLGGVGEIGKNMTLFEYGNTIVALDVGMASPVRKVPV